jgi:hypothetical protein
MNVWLVIEEFPDYETEISVHGTETQARAQVQKILDFHASENRVLRQWDDDRLIWSGTNEWLVEIQRKEVL